MAINQVVIKGGTEVISGNGGKGGDKDGAQKNSGKAKRHRKIGDANSWMRNI